MILQHVDSLFYVPDTTAFTALGDSDDEEGQDPFSQGEPDEEIMSKSQMYMILILLPKPLQFELRMDNMWYCKLLLFEIESNTDGHCCRWWYINTCRWWYINAWGLKWATSQYL
jgi:hypothetical protein